MSTHDSEPEPEFFYEDDRLEEFVDLVHETAEEHEEIPALLDALEEPFEEMLEADDWLPDSFCELPGEDEEGKGNMGDDIAQWLLYRFGNKLALFTLVLPPGASTPVHDHLSWGLVGIFSGAQREDFYRRVDDGGHEGDADLERLRTERNGPGDYYRLVPPNNDIHSVETVSDEPSVSVHLLGADVGCLERHAFDVDEGEVEIFHSGYSNVACNVVMDPPEGDRVHEDGHDHGGYGHTHDGADHDHDGDHEHTHDNGDLLEHDD